MPIDVTMPRLSDTMEAGTVVRWHVKEGDAVTSGAVVADIETDKATMEMQVFDDGTIAKILVPEGKSVSVGTKIAEIAGEGESDSGGDGAAAETSGERGRQRRDERESAGGEEGDRVRDGKREDEDEGEREGKDEEKGVEPSRDADAPTRSESTPRGRAPMRVSPVARRMAEEFGVDLSQVRGSGPGGRIIKRDIETAAETRGARAPGESAPSGPRDASKSGASKAPSAPRDSSEARSPSTPRAASGPLERSGAPLAAPIVPAASGAALGASGIQSVDVPLSSMRQTIAKRLVESVQTIPHYQVSMTFAMDALMALRSSLNAELESLGIKLSVNDFVVRACALAMSRHPFCNASWGGDHIVVHQTVNVGVAVALDEDRGGGLIVAVIRDTDRKSLRQISAETKVLSEKARSKGLTMEEMSGSTFTISNLGMFGVDHFTAIINPPNSAILACGAAVQKPVVRDGELAVGWEMTATMSSDHRVIDGAMAARYLQSLKHLFEHPTLLLV